MDPKTKVNKRTKTKDEPQEEEKLKETKEEKQSGAHQARVRFVNEEVKAMQSQRDQGYEFFGYNDDNKKLTLIDYINESEKRLNSIIEKPDWKDDWQNNVFDPITREKFNAVLARLAAQRMKAQFFNDEGLATDLAVIITNMYEKAARGRNGLGKDEVFLYRSMFEAASKGTVIREESYRLGKRKIKIGQPDKNGKVKYKIIYEWEDVWSEIVPLEEWYPGDISKLDIQEMGKCARVSYLEYETFRQKFADYKDVDLVKPINELTDEEKTQFSISEDREDGVVKVSKYYNRLTDSFDIAANNILLTPLGNPLPHPHKQLPFTVGRFELLSNKFFYGMSLSFKLAGMQDVSNSIWNMMLDEMYIALHKPIFNASGAEIDIDWLYPRSVIDLPKNTDTNKIREFQITPQANVAQAALTIIKNRMDESSAISREQSGSSGGGRARTAEEVATAREAALDIMGMFLTFMEWAEEDRAEQRVQNMLYYYSKPKKNGKYRRFIVDNVRLIGNELGKMEVNITKAPRVKDELNQANMQTEEMSQIVDITPDILRNFKYLIKIIPNSSMKETEFRRKQEELQWYQLTAANPMINQKENLKDLAEIFGKDISKILNQEQPEMIPEDLGGAMPKLPANASGVDKMM